MPRPALLLYSSPVRDRLPTRSQLRGTELPEHHTRSPPSDRHPLPSPLSRRVGSVRCSKKPHSPAGLDHNLADRGACLRADVEQADGDSPGERGHVDQLFFPFKANGLNPS